MLLATQRGGGLHASLCRVVGHQDSGKVGVVVRMVWWQGWCGGKDGVVARMVWW